MVLNSPNAHTYLVQIQWSKIFVIVLSIDNAVEKNNFVCIKQA